MVHGKIGIEIPKKFGIVEKGVGRTQGGSKGTKNLFKMEFGVVFECHESPGDDGISGEVMKFPGEVGVDEKGGMKSRSFFGDLLLLFLRSAPGGRRT
jgi:hypothetical protein